MLSKDYYKERINEVESSYNFNNGYQFLYCPWSSIGLHEVACITLNRTNLVKGTEPREHTIKTQTIKIKISKLLSV